MLKSRFIRAVVENLYAIEVAFSIGKWAVHMAYLERGYEAVGGEYFLIIMAYWVAWKIIHYLFDALEELNCERNREKRGS